MALRSFWITLFIGEGEKSDFFYFIFFLVRNGVKNDKF